MSTGSGRHRARSRTTAVAAGIGVGVIAGAIAGLVVAGPALRAYMFVVRIASPDSMTGLSTDDGFTIGAVTADTVGFVLQVGALSAVVGGAYAIVRMVLAPRVAAPLFTLAMLGLGSGALIHDDGIDFVLLGPLPVSVGGLVVAGAIGCVAIVLAVEVAGRRTDRGQGVGPVPRPIQTVMAATAVSILTVIAVGGAIRALWTIQDLTDLRNGLGSIDSGGSR
jgi:hypothetical protein